MFAIYSFFSFCDGYMPVLLIILDGWGLSAEVAGSAVAAAETPFMDACWKKQPHSQLITSGEAVGLPPGQMGNSEVGHTHIGAGRVIYQDLLRINQEIARGQLPQHPTLIRLLSEAKARGAQVHFMGLLSTGGVHAHVDHLEALCQVAQARGIVRSYVHAFLDGRDMPPRSAARLLKELRPRLLPLGAEIVSCTGRYYAMDRDKRWARTQKTYQALSKGIGTRCKHIASALEAAYSAGISDEFLPPHILSDEQGAPVAYLKPQDLLICFNFRPDRMRQLMHMLTQAPHPEQGTEPLRLHGATLTNYDPRFKHLSILYEKENVRNTLGETLAQAGKKQLRMAETEKYPHVTFFFSGGREAPFVGEERILCPSPKVATYDLRPEMSAAAITQRLGPLLQAQVFDFICLNYANPDMVGHTGVFEAATRACAYVDSCAAEITKKARKAGYSVLIIADHGNAECMKHPDGSPHTAHTTNPVPCVLLSDKKGLRLRNGTLIDVAPTVLKLMDLPQPMDMKGSALYE